jgi:hypothetical protein
MATTVSAGGVVAFWSKDFRRGTLFLRMRVLGSVLGSVAVFGLLSRGALGVLVLLCALCLLAASGWASPGAARTGRV